MDFTNAALLIGAVFAITELVKRAVPALSGWALQLVPLAVAVAVTFLVAYSTYAHSVSVNGITLDNVNVAGLILIGLLIGGGSTVLHQTLGAVKNVGENQPVDLPPAKMFPPGS